MSVLTVVIYVIFILFLVVALYTEYRDVNCLDIKGDCCGAGMGKAYAHGRPEPGDSTEKLFEKLSITARYETSGIYWRRVYITAFIGSFLILYLFNSKVPTGIELISAFLITYIVFYLMIVMFQEWVTKPALAQFDLIIAQLKKSRVAVA